MEKLICPKCKSSDVINNPNFSGYSVNTCKYCGKDWVSKIEQKTKIINKEDNLRNNEYIDETLEENNEEICDYEYDSLYPYIWLIVYENGDTEKNNSL